MEVKGKVGLIWELSDDELRSVYPLSASAKEAGSDSRGASRSIGCRRTSGQSAFGSTFAFGRNGTLPRQVPNLSYRGGGSSSGNSMRWPPGRKPPLGDLPVIVLSSDERPSDPKPPKR